MVLGNDDVQQEYNQERYHQRASEDIAQQLGYELQNIGSGINAESQRQGNSDDHLVAVVHGLFIEKLNT